MEMQMDAPASDICAAPLPKRGRRRFQADLRAAAQAFQEGFEIRGLWITDFRDGEDEGSITCTVANVLSGKPLVTLSLLVSDTSEYMDGHSFMCFTQDEEAPEFILDVIASIPDKGACTIREIMERLLSLLARRIKSSSPRKAGLLTPEPDDDSDASMGDMEESDMDYMSESEGGNYGQETFGLHPVPDGMQHDILQSDFHQCVAAGYRPGIRHIGTNEVVLSVSMPTYKLADFIAPRALMAWDPRLLSAARHLTLAIPNIRGVYPVISERGTLVSAATLRHIVLTFKVGLTAGYKPSEEQCIQLARTHSLRQPQPVAPKPEPIRVYDSDESDTSSEFEDQDVGVEDVEEEIIEHDDSFGFSLSSSLEALMNDCFVELLELRAKYGFGWAAAEALRSKVHRLQRTVEDVMNEFALEILQADAEENQLANSYCLPPDPLDIGKITHMNLPLLAFCYLLRRLTLCSRFCLVCYDKINTDFQALKPYVCDDKLCTYQYYNLNRGPSLEYEICARPETVDLLVSLTYIAASEGGLHDFPDGMNLNVPDPQIKPKYNAVKGKYEEVPLCEFDTLSEINKCAAIKGLLDTLPPVLQMKKHLQKKATAGVAKSKLQEIDADVLPAAWSALRWIVASCTAYLEELTDPTDCVVGLGAEWRQFRFTVGSPDAEAKFLAEQQTARNTNHNANQYPSLYAWHGSPAKNWHSIIRHGLWYKEIAHGRAYGDGVYFAKDAHTSTGYSSRHATSTWSQSGLHVRTCLALAEIVNLPHMFRTSSPFYVVPRTDWIVCRYLMVYTLQSTSISVSPGQPTQAVPCVSLDPQNQLFGNAGSAIMIPEPSHKLEKLLAARRHEFVDVENDEEDKTVFATETRRQSGSELRASSGDDDSATVARSEDDWEHNPEWVAACVQHMLPPPVDATPMAVSSVQRELSAMLREQERTRSLKELGWYLPPDFVGDNLFQWIVELHSFDPELPVAKDMVARDVNSIVFEIRFPPDFPHAPPFFRILQPRFLPFIQGGGGHVTGGGSICMDLLTSDGWLPSYSVSAILLQIKLAISNPDPRPARLASNWNVPYSMREALEGFMRAANTHGWKIPQSVHSMSQW